MSAPHAFSDAQVQELSNLATRLKVPRRRGFLLTVQPSYAPVIARAIERGVLPSAYRKKIIAEMELRAEKVEALGATVDQLIADLEAKNARMDAKAVERAADRARRERIDGVLDGLLWLVLSLGLTGAASVFLGEIAARALAALS